MKIFIVGNPYIDEEYYSISDIDEYNFDDIMDDMTDEMINLGSNVSFLSRGEDEGVDKMLKEWCDEAGFDIEIIKSEKKLGSQGDRFRDISLVNNCDACLMFHMKYSDRHKYGLENIADMLFDQDKPLYVFNMEKYS